MVPDRFLRRYMKKTCVILFLVMQVFLAAMHKKIK